MQAIAFRGEDRGQAQNAASENHILLAQFNNTQAFSAPMSSPPLPPEPARVKPRRWPPWGTRVAGLIVATLIIGWAFAWAQSGSYQADRTAGFWLGLVHGAVMPAALPCLLAGKDVPIFAANNTGRTYKVGFLFGINCSGMVFFGLGFRPNPPKERPAEARRQP